MATTNDKLVRVKTNLLPNELHFRFHTENDQMYNKYGPSPLGIVTLFPTFHAKLADLDTALERIPKSADTARIVVADNEFDISYSGLHSYVRSCLHHYTPSVRRAAENVNVIFEHYGDIGRQPYHQELASSFNLLQDVRKRTADVSAMSLAPWLTAHEQAATALAALLNERTGETAKQTELRVREVRRELDELYQQITNRLDAMININGRNFVAGFVAEYNAHATEYKNKLAQHLGRIHAGKKTED
jgi:hypothetical protein